MSSDLISKHKTHTEKDGNDDKTEFAVVEGVEEYENIVEDIENYVKKESFYELPMKKILEIIGKSDIDDDDLLCEVISKMNAKKRKESTLLLNVIKKEEATLEECIEILSKFEHCPLCQRLGEVFNEYKEMPRIDYKYENGELREKIEKTSKQIKPIENH